MMMAVALLLSFTATGVQAKKKKKGADLLSALKKDSTNTDYSRITKDAKTHSGLFTVIHKAKEGKLYFEMPDSVFSRSYMLSNRVAATSDTHDYVAGQMVNRPMLINFTKDERNVYLHQVQTLDEVVEGDAMAPSFERNFLNPVLKAFKIAATHDGNVVIDVTQFFGGNEKSISPIQDAGPVAKLLGTANGLKGTFVSDASGVSEVKAFEKNIEVKSLLSFNTTGAVQKPYTVRMHRSLFVLPDEQAPRRFQDNRVGYFYTDKSIYSTSRDRIDDKTFIHRWRLEPKAEDRARYFRGEAVEPVKPIVFYVDTAFPEKWRNTIKEGILVWNRAFERAGFKNAVVVRDYPANDPQFDPDDMRYNCFKYAATSTANAMGPSYVDPRTGEILAADVIWYHNIVSLLHNWRFVQTGAVDARVRKTTFDDALMQESMKYAASHEIGHTLGLMHNMGASYSFPVDSLRSPSFTQRYGTTPSIMDYARNNYVAQPGDLERGVKLTPPELGVYDLYAIDWGYRLIEGASTPADEKATLDKWIAQHQGDPMYEFGAQQVAATIDPTDQTEDLGNDHVKACNLGISNLKVLMQNLEAWTLEPGERYDQVENMYRQVTTQYGRYVRHVLPYVGGIRFEEIRQGDGKATGKHYIPKQQQRQAMEWLIAQAQSYDSWLTPKSLIAKLELDMNVNDRLRSTIVSGLLSSAVLYRIKEGGEADPARNYRLDDYLNDVTNQLFTAPKGGRLTQAQQQLQDAALQLMLRGSGLVARTTSSSSSSSLTAISATDQTPSLPLCSLLLPANDAQVRADGFSPSGDPCTATDDLHSFARINLGTASLSATQLGAIMTGRLKRVLQKLRTYRAQATGSTRDFYDYQILLIEKAFATK